MQYSPASGSDAGGSGSDGYDSSGSDSEGDRNLSGLSPVLIPRKYTNVLRRKFVLRRGSNLLWGGGR